MSAAPSPGSPSLFLHELLTIFTIEYIFISNEQSRCSLSVNCCPVGFLTGDRLTKKPGLSKGTSFNPHLLPMTKGEKIAIDCKMARRKAWKTLWVLQVVKGNWAKISIQIFQISFLTCSYLFCSSTFPKAAQNPKVWPIKISACSHVHSQARWHLTPAPCKTNHNELIPQECKTDIF